MTSLIGRLPRIRSHALRIAVAALAILWPCAVRAQLTEIHTPSLRLFYFEPAEAFLVPHAARTFLNSLAFQRRVLTFDPKRRINVLLTDFADAGNAGAAVVPYDTVSVQIAPFNFAFETIAGNDRMNIIMNHELVHLATMDQAASSDRVFRRLFMGKVAPLPEQPESILHFFLTAPRVAAPRWFHEGIAVFLDTWMAGGLGRAQGGYDEMVFRSMVRDGSPFYDPLGLVAEGTRIDFQVEVNSYLYGARFMTWLARKHSPDKLIEWVSRPDGSRGYYSSQFRHVYGTSLEQAWAQWIEDEHQFQRANLEAIRKYPVTTARDLTSRALGSISRAYFDRITNTIFAALNYPGVVSHVGAIAADNGAVRKIADIKGPSIYTVTSLAYDADRRSLFYTTDNNAHRDLMRVNPDTGRTEMLQRDVRIGDLAFNRADKSLWGLRHLNGIVSIVRVPEPYRDWERVVSWPYGVVPYDLDVSPDGTRVAASFGEASGQQDVRVFETASLLRGETTPLTKFDFGTAVPNGFVFSPDGRYLYGSSYYTGASNIFRYDLETKALEAMTNAETGFFRPIPLGENQLIVFRYSGAGFVPARLDVTPLNDVSAITFLGAKLAEEQPVVKTWNVGSPAAVAFDDNAEKIPYRIGRRLGRESAYPIVQGYKDTAAVGYRLNLSDPLQLNRFHVSATVSPGGDVVAEERLHVDAQYERYNWRGRFTWNGADFYDLAGPTKKSLKGYVGEIGHKTTLVFDEPRRVDLDLRAQVAGRLDRLPEFQNIAVDVERLASAEARFSYSNIRKSLGYVDDETGRKGAVVLSGDYVNRSLTPKLYATYDHGVALPVEHSSIWWRNAAGFSTRDRTNPFSNFYFGGFGNNWMDHGDEKRYRAWYSFPGVELNEIGGRNFVKSTGEWNLPPLRFSRVGTPGLYVAWMRPALFVTGLSTDVDSSSRRVAGAFGGQLDFRVGALSVLELTLSVGAAVAVQDGQRPSREAMISLKILK